MRRQIAPNRADVMLPNSVDSFTDAATTAVSSEHTLIEGPAQFLGEPAVPAESSQFGARVTGEPEIRKEFPRSGNYALEMDAKVLKAFDSEDDPLFQSSATTQRGTAKFRPKRNLKTTKSIPASLNSVDIMQNASTAACQSGLQVSESDRSLQHNLDNLQPELDATPVGIESVDDILMHPSEITVKQVSKFLPKSGLRSKGHKNKSVSFKLPDETKTSPLPEQASLPCLETSETNIKEKPTSSNRDSNHLDIEPMEENDRSTRDDPSTILANEHAESPGCSEEFESIDDIMDIDSWDDQSMPPDLERADKTSRTLIKRDSAKSSEKNDFRNNGSRDAWDSNEDNDDEYRGENLTTDNTNNAKKTKRQRKSSKELDSTKTEQPKKKFTHGTKQKRRQVDKGLLGKPDNEIDHRNLPIRDLILLAGAKERISSKEAAILKTQSNCESNADHDNPLDDEGFDPDSEEAHRHMLRNSKKLNYQTHMDKPRSGRWSKEETARFYEAIHEFGTDFEIIAYHLGRTRQQIKSKFKIEERKHPAEVHDATINRSKDHSLSDRVIQQLKASAEADDNAANGTKEVRGQPEEEEQVAKKSDGEADNSEEHDTWDDCESLDLNECADFELDVNNSFT